jgi:L-iditol 2-dehydrogenase
MEQIHIMAAVLHGKQDISVESRTISPPGPEEVQVLITHVGICGSDVHYYKQYALDSNTLVEEPLILGHEAAGTIISVGNGVTLHKVGDKVALENGVPCSNCKVCRSGHYNVCPALRFRSSAKSFPHFQGTLQEKVNHPASHCHLLPENMKLDMGALLEPLSVATHAVRRWNPQRVRTDGTILVLGAGAVGLLVAATATQYAAQVVMMDIDSKRLAFACEHGFADSTLTVDKIRPDTYADARKEIEKQTKRLTSYNLPTQYDGIFECTGAEFCLQFAIHVGLFSVLESS